MNKCCNVRGTGTRMHSLCTWKMNLRLSRLQCEAVLFALAEEPICLIELSDALSGVDLGLGARDPLRRKGSFIKG